MREPISSHGSAGSYSTRRTSKKQLMRLLTQMKRLWPAFIKWLS
uniref:Uncharacterized protein n=1 Tax=Rhizophora mucronata TaxID=61149 RepID=A0A2P2NK28_RHIMU